MKKFKFELEKVLEYRTFEKERAEAELSKALAVENRINEDLKNIALQFINLKQQMKGSLDFRDVVSQDQYSNLLNYQKEELLKELAQAKIVSEQKRDVLRECMKKTIALEELKKKQLAEYKEAEEYEESELMDEMATSKGNCKN